MSENASRVVLWEPTVARRKEYVRPDYVYKAKLMNENPGIIKAEARLHKLGFGKGDKKAMAHWIKSRFRCRAFNEARKINRARYSRTRRLEGRVRALVEDGGAVFLTLTFTDEVMRSTTAETRRRYVKRYLAEQSSNYVANIDYGATKGREHYHAVAVGPVDYGPWHDRGAIKGERIHKTESAPVKLAKYTSKLTNHAIKETARGCSVIYSR